MSFKIVEKGIFQEDELVAQLKAPGEVAGKKCSFFCDSANFYFLNDRFRCAKSRKISSYCVTQWRFKICGSVWRILVMKHFDHEVLASGRTMAKTGQLFQLS